jgi:IS30 family transposase
MPPRLDSLAERSTIEIFFCDPHSPGQQGTNANTTGLLRQYFPKVSDLSVHSAAGVDSVAREPHDRPGRRRGFRKPIEQIGELLLR